MRRMRCLLSALLVAGSGSAAIAADLPLLRGSSAFQVGAPLRWDGIYFGAQVGYNVAGGDFDNTTGSISALLLQGGTFTTVNATPLGTDDKPSAHFGGFIGYNSQWDGAVIGVEGNYNRYNVTLATTNTLSGTYVAADANSYLFTGNGSATVRITDVGTFRLRGGWDAGNFMPYGFVGLAVGRAEIDRSATVTLVPPPGVPAGSPVLGPVTLATSQTGQFTYGWTMGVGLDIALMSNFFVRAEYEYVQFGDFQQVNLHMHNARVAAAFKF